MKRITLFALFSAAVAVCNAQTRVFNTVATGVPLQDENSIFQQLQYSSNTAFSGKVRLIASQVREKDSVILYRKEYRDIEFTEGQQELRFDLLKGGVEAALDRGFIQAIKATGVTPPGMYNSRVEIWANDTLVLARDWLTLVDSNLAPTGKLRSKVASLASGISPEKIVAQGKEQVKQSGRKRESSAAEHLRNSTARVNTGLGRKDGLSVQPQNRDGKSYLAMYSGDWFVGRYEVKAAAQAKDAVVQEYQTLKNNAGALVTSNLEDFKSVSTQVRELFKNSDQDNDINGNIDVNTYAGTGQEPGSQQENNYTEIAGMVSTEVMDIPVSIEGYYTTQDLRRQAKASFVRVHYDAEKAKSELMKIIGTYKTKFSEAGAKGKGLEQVYGSYQQRLSNEKDRMLADIGKDYGLDAASFKSSGGSADALIAALAKDTVGLTQKLADKALDASGKDSVAAAAKKNYAEKLAKINKAKDTLMKRYEQVMELERKYQKYKTLLSQYQDQMTMDSALTYKKLEALGGKDASYKELSQAAAGLLPEGKAKKLVTGLTHFDAGIIDQYESRYTMAGQTIKGASVGYDVGFGKVGATVGKTEYVSREGGVDRYNSYLGRLDIKPFAGGQKIGLIYYSSSPSKQMLKSDNFIGDVAAAVPSFTSPVHVASVTYEGSIGKDLLIQAEAGASMRKGQQLIGNDNTAIKTTLDYNLRPLQANVQAEWEHLGKNFENGALPYLRAATDRYTAAVSTDLFNSFLSVAVNYNYLLQENFNGTGRSTKWGFDLKTHSKQYPSVQLSYKPFATFRSQNDTLAIPQRPLMGEVWLGRGSYQLKHGKNVQRFTLLYNRSTSTMDTSSYASATLQAGYNYSNQHTSWMLNAGHMQMPVNFQDGSGTATSWFVNAGVSGQLVKSLQASLTQDVAVADFGLQRIATTIGLGYQLKKYPLSLRTAVRYSQFRLTEADAAVTNWNGQLGFGWQFKRKIRK